MKSLLTLILQVLKDSYIEVKEIKDLMAKSRSAHPARLLNKNQVLSLLNISDTTYRRYVKAGRLKPMKLKGIDMYREEDLLRELQESRRKGRF